MIGYCNKIVAMSIFFINFANHFGMIIECCCDVSVTVSVARLKMK